MVGRAAASREPVQVPNILEERTYAPRMREMLERFGFRASWLFLYYAKPASSAGWWYGENPPASFVPKSSSF